MIVAPVVIALSAVAGDHSGFTSRTQSEGVLSGLTREQALRLPRFVTTGSGRSARAVLFEYRTVEPCGRNLDQEREQVSCGSNRGCEGVESPTSGLLKVLRRVAKPGQDAQAGWETVGMTCFGQQVPAGGRGLSMDALAAAFARTPFAKPQAVMQPVGNRTLVGLPTFFQVSWPREGFGPGEVNSLRLAGVGVRVRPVLVHHVYDFGDGSTSGPTTSSGGPWPDGDVRHTYERKGVVNPKITSTFTGEASLDGGVTWFPVPGTASVSGPVAPLTVLTAKNRLVTH